MDVLADQFSVPFPARVSRTASSVSQSATKEGLLFGLGTAVPVAQAVPSNNGVPAIAADHWPSPAPLTDLTCTSYCVPPIRPVTS